MKRCSICKQLKDENEFPYQNIKPNKRMSACKECKSKLKKQKRKDNPELQREKDRIAYQRQKETRIKYAYDYRKAYPERTRDANLFSKYRIRSSDYDKMREEQNNKRAICGTDQCDLKRPLSVDHNHETNKIRGLLCDICNISLGFYEKLGEQCREYLEKYS